MQKNRESSFDKLHSSGDDSSADGWRYYFSYRKFDINGITTEKVNRTGVLHNLCHKLQNLGDKPVIITLLQD